MTTQDILASYYEAFNGGNAAGMLELFAEDVVHDINQGESEKGKKAFQKFLKMMDEAYREKASDIQIMVNKDGSRASAEFIIDGTYLKTVEGLPAAKQQKYHLRVGTFFEIKAKKITRVTNYYNLPDWLSQVE